jgi:hypothetical protein
MMLELLAQQSENTIKRKQGRYLLLIYLQLMHNRSELIAVLGPNEALPYYIHIYIFAVNLQTFSVTQITQSRMIA